MNKEQFQVAKGRLLEIIDANIGLQDGESFERLRRMLSYYSFENRMRMKGAITRLIVDCLSIDYAVAEQFIEFDSYI